MRFAAYDMMLFEDSSRQISLTSALYRGTSYQRRYVTNTPQYLRNCARYDVCSYYSLIGSRIWTFYWYQNRLASLRTNYDVPVCPALLSYFLKLRIYVCVCKLVIYILHISCWIANGELVILCKDCEHAKKGLFAIAISFHHLSHDRE